VTRKKESQDDKDIWHRVARTVSPLKKRSSKPEQKITDHMWVSPPRPVTQKDKQPQPLSTRQDKKTRRGKVDIGAKIDLHDMTQTEAFSALQRTIIRSYNRNKKCVLVVTGKGLRGQGVLRRSLPEWLAHPEIRHIVSEFAPAHQRHGGSGAWYVFLKSGSRV